MVVMEEYLMMQSILIFGDRFKEIKKFIRNKNIITNIYRIQAYGSIMYGYFCIRFIAFMQKGESLLDYTNLFCPNEYEKNDKIILKYFHLLKVKDEKIILGYLW